MAPGKQKKVEQTKIESENVLKIPTLSETESLLSEAEKLNPGPWVQHSIYVAKAAQAIAHHHPKLDSEDAYILGCLHDIGRREGITNQRHIIDGYNFLIPKGFDDAARICLTHSYPVQDIKVNIGEWDCSEAERKFVADYIATIEYTEYDKLFQLCDALVLPSGYCLLEKRWVDVALRYGTNQYTVPKWKATLEIQKYFEKIIGQSIYNVLPGVVENTFGF
jgi:hypothetical protein